MARMVVIGPERFTLPFGAIGFEMVEAEPADFMGALRGLLDDRSVGLVACGESFVTKPAMQEVKELCSEAQAAVLVVPDGPEAQGTGYELIRSVIERAAGVDLLTSVDEGAAAAPTES